MILALETATKNCSVALVNTDGGNLTLREHSSEKYSHAEKLNGFIQEVLDAAGKTFSDLDAIAVSKGPGSYTGLRIGVSTAKGLCYALNIPLISIGTLPAMAHGAMLKEESFEAYVPMIDARRMEVFTQSYSKDKREIDKLRAQIVESESFDHLIGKKTLFFGDGAAKCEETLDKEEFVFLKEFEPSAADVAQLAIEKFKAKDFEDVAYFEPFYLKDFIAGPPPKKAKA
jgi:tRNA threonylcarbamoyladenosine biosynthesis protein TsaB